MKNTSLSVVYLLTPTSNHNIIVPFYNKIQVVYLLTPTSNHNSYAYAPRYLELYIF